jgi:hypothetical protein
MGGFVFGRKLYHKNWVNSASIYDIKVVGSFFRQNLETLFIYPQKNVIVFSISRNDNTSEV